MTTTPPNRLLPAQRAFDRASSTLRSPRPGLTAHPEFELELLAQEIVRYDPDFAEMLALAGARRLRAELAEA